MGAKAEAAKGSCSIKWRDSSYQARLLFTAFEMRVFNLLIGIICIIALKKLLGIMVPVQMFLIFPCWLLISLAYMVFFRNAGSYRRKVLDNVHFSYYFAGVVMGALTVHYMGGAEWIAVFIFLFDIVYGNVLLSRVRGMLITLFAVICYLSLVYLEYSGIIPHYSLFGDLSRPYSDPVYLLSTNVIAVVGIFALLSYSTGLFSTMKKDREKSISESRNRYQAKSRKLEEITMELRRKVAENKYIKNATMGYIAKKEFELQRVRKDLEAHIDKLRTTQTSMKYMIDDLNGMSGQLKEARDNLEEKVRERTDELLSITRKLQRSERLAFLGKLSGSVTHELRNPLAVLKNAAYFLEKKFGSSRDETLTRYLGIIKKEITSIDSIIDDIMGFARTRAPDLKKGDIRDVVDNVLGIIDVPDLIDVRKEYKDVPSILLDENQLLHALSNVANNAIVAMNGNGVLSLSVYQKDSEIIVEVGDTGPGIPPEQRELIFEPLYSSKPRGTGLGLPLARMMVEGQEGYIDFESRLGVGTVFRIVLPAREDEEVSNA